MIQQEGCQCVDGRDGQQRCRNSKDRQDQRGLPGSQGVHRPADKALCRIETGPRGRKSRVGFYTGRYLPEFSTDTGYLGKEQHDKQERNRQRNDLMEIPLQVQSHEGKGR